MTSSAIHNWTDLENCQINVNAHNEATIRQAEADRRRKYKEELDLLIRLKNEVQNRDHHTARATQLESAKNMEAFAQRERQEEGYLRQLQRQQFAESLDEQEKRRRQKAEQSQAERHEANLINLQSQSQLLQEQRSRQQTRQRQVTECREHYQDTLERKRRAQVEQDILDKDYYRKEKEMHERMARDNEEFMRRIQLARRRHEEVLECYESLDQQKRQKRENIDRLFVEKGFFDKERKEIEREAAELERMRALKRDVTQTLQRQIENNRLKKEMLEFEELRRESEVLRKEMALKKGREEEKKLERQRVIAEMMRGLDQQMADRRARIQGKNELTSTEEGLNCYQTTGEGVVACPEKTVEAIPGFCVQEDKKKMLRIQESDAVNTEKQLQSALMGRSHLLGPVDTNTRRTNVLRLINASSVDNLCRTRSKFKNDYDFLRYKNMHKNFDIISNKPVMF